MLTVELGPKNGIHVQMAKANIRSLLTGLALAFALSACSGTRELGPTYFIDADRTDYIKDERDFPQMGKYDNMPPVVRAPSNVLDEIKALPDRVRDLRRDDSKESASQSETDLVRSDAPTSKPVDAAEEEEVERVVPAKDIAKSLIGDQSSNSYTDYPLRGDVLASAESRFDDFTPVPVQIVALPTGVDFAPQPVLAKRPAAPKQMARISDATVQADLGTLRRTTYQQKLTESSRKVVRATGRVDFSNSSVTPPILRASVDSSGGSDPQSETTSGTPFVVLARINADGLLLSAKMADTGPGVDASAQMAQADLRPSRPLSSKKVDVTVVNLAALIPAEEFDVPATVLAAR